jgi:hypothetical protein
MVAAKVAAEEVQWPSLEAEAILQLVDRNTGTRQGKQAVTSGEAGERGQGGGRDQEDNDVFHRTARPVHVFSPFASSSSPNLSAKSSVNCRSRTSRQDPEVHTTRSIPRSAAKVQDVSYLLGGARADARTKAQQLPLMNASYPTRTPERIESAKGYRIAKKPAGPESAQARELRRYPLLARTQPTYNRNVPTAFLNNQAEAERKRLKLMWRYENQEALRTRFHHWRHGT